MLKLVGGDVPSIEEFMRRYRMDHPAALHRLQVGVPATVEHSSEAGPETGKWVAETTQSFITFMDALKLRLRAKDQLHPILQELVTGFARFKGSKDWEGRSRMVGWYVLVSEFHCGQFPNRVLSVCRGADGSFDVGFGL